MKRIFFISACVLFLSGKAGAQVTEGEKILREQTIDTLLGWNIGGIAGLNLTQTSFTNWSAGGQNTVAGNALFSVFANYKGLNSSWDNTVDLGYGLVMQGKNNDVLKTDDKIELISKYGQRAFKNWFYAGLLNFRTQFTPGYNYPDDSTVISDFMAPGYLLGAIGMDYKPNEFFSVFIAPVSAKLTFVNYQPLANAGAFGVEPAKLDTNGNVITPGENFRLELGGYLRTQLQRELTKNVLLNSRLDLFSNYLDEPGNIDVNWNNVLALKVNDYISATLSTELIYDDDVRIPVDDNDDGIPDRAGPRVQFKEVLAIGLNYKF